MNRFLLLFFLVGFYSCDNERILQLPKIKNAEVTKVLDVSPAYIFYDETQPDSSLLNRKNLIGTTNWLVNVDRRLTLRQAIPHIKFLQNKKRGAQMHKNKDARNYFTCNDTAINDLGFIEFTNVFYKKENPDFVNYVMSQTGNYLTLKFNKGRRISVASYVQDTAVNIIELEEINSFQTLENYFESTNPENVVLLFESAMTFQNYISIKSELQKIQNEKLTIDLNEFIY